jgi:hypothetical protein
METINSDLIVRVDASLKIFFQKYDLSYRCWRLLGCRIVLTPTFTAAIGKLPEKIMGTTIPILINIPPRGHFPTAATCALGRKRHRLNKRHLTSTID